MRGIVATAACALALAGCMSGDRLTFKQSRGQTALVRDGRHAISSVGKESIVLVSSRSREVQQGQRVGLVVAIQSRSKQPVEFRIGGVSANQTFAGGNDQQLEVLTFEQLQSEERSRQVLAAILVGAAAAANSAAASQAGYYRGTTTIYTPRGTLIANTQGYSPGAAAIAAANAGAQNEAMIGSAVAQGQANMARLENEYIKDHTLLPGEWYGGTVLIAPPIGNERTAAKTYRIQVKVGADVHLFDAVQEPIG